MGCMLVLASQQAEGKDKSTRAAKIKEELLGLMELIHASENFPSTLALESTYH